MNLIKGYIQLTHETGWKKPIQARIYKRFHGKIKVFHFFAEWETFEEAIVWLKYKHGHYDIIVKRQTVIGI
jgi:hypothetical protein